MKSHFQTITFKTNKLNKPNPTIPAQNLGDGADLWVLGQPGLYSDVNHHHHHHHKQKCFRLRDSEDTRWVKCLLYEYVDLNLLSSTRVKAGVWRGCVCNLSARGLGMAEGRDKWISVAHWPVSLRTTVSSRFSERLNKTKQRWQSGEDIWSQPLAFTGTNKLTEHHTHTHNKNSLGWGVWNWWYWIIFNVKEQQLPIIYVSENMCMYKSVCVPPCMKSYSKRKFYIRTLQ